MDVKTMMGQQPAQETGEMDHGAKMARMMEMMTQMRAMMDEMMGMMDEGEGQAVQRGFESVDQGM